MIKKPTPHASGIPGQDNFPLTEKYYIVTWPIHQKKKKPEKK